MSVFSSSFFQESLLHVRVLEDLDLQKLMRVLETHTFACLRGLISPEELTVAKEMLRKNFDPSRDSPSTGESPEQIMGVYQKLSVGGVVPNQKIQAEGVKSAGVIRPRFMRTLYTPFWEKDVFGLHKPFRRLCEVRNLLYGFPLNFCIDRVEDGFWTAARIHHYPSGGGFLMPHRDEVLPLIQKQKGLPTYYQPLLVMSKKGKDFFQGGGFIEFQGERFYYEEFCEWGDIVVYDGRTVHGVEDVDPHERLDLNSLKGRWAGFVSLYRDLRKGGNRGS